MNTSTEHTNSVPVKSLTTEEWRTIHNALAVYQSTFTNIEAHPSVLKLRQQIQALMDKIRDEHIAP